MNSPVDEYYNGYQRLPERLRKKLSCADLREIYKRMVRPVIQDE